MPKGLYTDNDGDTHFCRVGTKAFAAGGFTTGSSPSSKIPAKVSKNNKEFGLRPRMLAISRPANPGPTEKVYRQRIPIATQSLWNASTVGSTIGYGGETWVVDDQIPEDYK